MNKGEEATLSRHLLREAARFLPYPTRVYRTRTNLGAQEYVQALFRKIVEWRKTFAPVEGFDALPAPVVLDDLYCRELLLAVSDMVERTRTLSNLVLSNLPDDESFVYLREAANCCLFGLPSAAVALAGAAVEESLRKRCSERFGRRAALAEKFHQLVEDAARGRLLSRAGLARVRKIQDAANRVLHREPTRSDEALTVVEDARSVILELTRIQGSMPRPSSRVAKPTQEDAPSNSG